MAEPEINVFLTHLAVKEKVSASTQNQALSALLFLYRHVLDRRIGDLGEVIRARRPKRLPVVLTREEVKAVLGNLTGDKWLMASLMYGAGLRRELSRTAATAGVSPATGAGRGPSRQANHRAGWEGFPGSADDGA